MLEERNDSCGTYYDSLHVPLYYYHDSERLSDSIYLPSSSLFSLPRSLTLQAIHILEPHYAGMLSLVVLPGPGETLQLALAKIPGVLCLVWKATFECTYRLVEPVVLQPLRIVT